jgi:hypothetical protein
MSPLANGKLESNLFICLFDYRPCRRQKCNMQNSSILYTQWIVLKQKNQSISNIKLDFLKFVIY